MAFLVANVPPVKVHVKKEYLYDHQRGHGEFTEGIWVTCKSIQGRALYFETYLPEYEVQDYIEQHEEEYKVDDGVINFSVAEQKLFPALLTNPKQEVSQLIDTLNLRQTGDEDTLHQLIQEVLDENPHKVEEYKAGKTGLIGMFMGQIMKKSGGKADPKKTKSLLVELLDN